MGVHHARVLAESPRCRLAVVIDSDLKRAERLAEMYGARASSDLADARQARAAVVATATAAHVAVTTELLAAGLPVLVEKPLAPTLDGVRELVSAAEHRDVPLMCGFVERYNPVVVTALELLDGPVVHAVAVRHSPPAPRIGTGVVPDLLIHDLDLVTRVFGIAPSAVTASAWRPSGQRWEEVVDCTLRFGGSGLATLSADRHSQRKLRTLSLSTQTQLLELDLMRQDITAYRHVDHELLEQRTGYRAQTVIDIPFVKQSGEPLARQLAHFVALVDGSADAGAERRSLLPPHELAAEVEELCATVIV